MEGGRGSGGRGGVDGGGGKEGERLMHTPSLFPQSSSQFTSRDVLLAEMEKYGGVFDCQRFRDVMLYSMSVLSFSVPEAVRILADTLWRPGLREEEVRDGGRRGGRGEGGRKGEGREKGRGEGGKGEKRGGGEREEERGRKREN